MPKIKGWEGSSIAQASIKKMRYDVVEAAVCLDAIVSLCMLEHMQGGPWLDRVQDLGAFGETFECLLEQLKGIAGQSEEDLVKEEPDHTRRTKECKVLVRGSSNALKAVVHARIARAIAAQKAETPSIPPSVEEL